MVSKYTTLQWIMFWGIMTIMAGWWTQEVESFSTFLIVVASFLILVGGIFLQKWKAWKRRHDLSKIDVAFYIRNTEPPLSKTLTVGIGTHTVFLIITSKTDVLLNAPVLEFRGDGINKPINDGSDYGDMFKTLASGQIRDQWGTVTSPSEYPRPLAFGQNWPLGIRVRATGSWVGKLRIQIPVNGGSIICRLLDFTVTPDKADALPEMIQNPVFGPDRAASTTQITNDPERMLP